MMTIVWLLVWTIGGFLIFGISAFIYKLFEPLLGKSAILIAAIFFIVVLIFFSGVVPISMDLSPGRPFFFGDSQ